MLQRTQLECPILSLDESFESVLSIAVPEHVRYPFVTMKEVHRMLEPGGQLIGTIALLEPFHDQSLDHHSQLGVLKMGSSLRPRREISMARGAILVTSLALGAWAIGCAQRSNTPTGPPAENQATSAEANRLLGLSLDRWVERSVRLQHVSQRLRIAGHDLCRDSRAPVLGVAVQDLSLLPLELGNLARERYGADTGLIVLSVFPDLVGDQEDLRAGDHLVALGGRSVDEINDLDRRLDSPIRVDLRRGSESLKIQLEPVLGCGFPAQLVRSETVNAYANSEIVIFTTAFMREVTNDTHLATVIGHELAHNLLDGHPNRSTIAKRLRESRADHIGVYLAAIAGYSVTETDDFQTRLERNLNLLADRKGSHPVTSERVAAYRKTIEQIRKQQDGGLPLVPETQ